MEDEVGNTTKDAANNEKGKKTDTKDAAKVLGEGFAVLEEDDGAFTGGFARFLVFAIEDPAETAITEVGYDGLNNARDGATDSSTIVATDGSTNSSDGLADLLENTFDDASGSIIDCYGRETVFDDLFAGADDVFGEFVLGNGDGHHGDLTSFVAI